MRVFFWPQRGIYDTSTSTIAEMIAHLRGYGGDRSNWAVLAYTNQGFLDITADVVGAL